MGTKVTLVEFMPTILPVEDEEVSKQVGRSFKKAGIEVLVNLPSRVSIPVVNY